MSMNQEVVNSIYEFAYNNEQEVLGHFGVDSIDELFHGQHRPEPLEIMATSVDLGELNLAWYTPGCKFYGGTSICVNEFLEWMEEVMELRGSHDMQLAGR